MTYFENSITAMAAVVDQTVKSYHQDFEYDTARIKDAGFDDVFLWAPRSNGTQLASLVFEGEAKDAREYIEAVQKVMAPPIWYLVTRHRIDAVSPKEAMALACKYAGKATMAARIAA